MKKLLFVVLTSISPELLLAAGTYYNGNYTGIQNRYNQPAGFQANSYQPGQNRNFNSINTNYNTFGTRQYSNGYQRTNNYMNYSQNNRYQQNQNFSNNNTAPQRSSDNKKITLNAGLSREIGTWNMEMKEAGSILSYNNLSWNVFSANAGYSFNAGDIKLKIDGGLKYGLQSGSSSMIDDDITKGGIGGTKWIDQNDPNKILEESSIAALSIGKSEDGNQFGLNIGLGFQDVFKIGKANFTPSFGYRIFKHKLQTNKNYGLSIERTTKNCIEVNGEKQCDIVLVAVDNNGSKTILNRSKVNYDYSITNLPGGINDLDAGNTYYFSQPGVSHIYETSWNGLYLAMDMLYEINPYNNVDGRLEIGLPSYFSEGSQPYRKDWKNPKSVEDSKEIFGALHLGFSSNYNTNINDNVMLSIGFTYDYYSVNGANAKTFLSSDFYNGKINEIEQLWTGDPAKLKDNNFSGPDFTGLDNKQKNLKYAYKSLKSNMDACKSWVCSADNEVISFYKSMGIRAGIKVKF